MLRNTALPRLLSLAGAFLTGALLSPAAAAPLAAQQDATTVTRLVPSAAQLTVARGDQVPFAVQAIDASGAVVHVELRITGPRDRIQIRDGVVVGLEPGEYTLHLRLDLPGRTPAITSRPIFVGN